MTDKHTVPLNAYVAKYLLHANIFFEGVGWLFVV
jgi:hypothetical protein